MFEKFVKTIKNGTSFLHKNEVAVQPFNPITGKEFNEINDFKLTAENRPDPRWMTASQLVQAGYALEPNARPVDLSYFITEEKGVKLDSPKLIKAQVYNGADIMGLEKFDLQEEKGRWVLESKINEKDMLKSISSAGLKFDNSIDGQKKLQAIVQLATFYHNRKNFHKQDPIKTTDGFEIMLGDKSTKFANEAVMKAAIKLASSFQDLYASMEYKKIQAKNNFPAGDKSEKELLKSLDNVKNDFDKFQNVRQKIELSEDKAMQNIPEKIYVKADFQNKDLAKSQGAAWDKEKKSWFVAPNNDKIDFKIFPKHTPEPVIEPSVLFKEEAAKKGLIIDGELTIGKSTRCAVEGDKPGKKSGTYIYHENGVPNGVITNFKTGEIGQKWIKTNQSKLSGERKIENPKHAEIQAKNNDNRIAIYAQKAKQAFAIIADKAKNYAKSMNDHPYLQVKNIKPYGIKIDKGNEEFPRNSLVIPIHNIKGEIRSIQFIDSEGKKTFMKDAEKSGNFNLIDSNAKFDIKPIDRKYNDIIICEGYATGASLHEATGKPVAVAFDATNLSRVAENIRGAYPNANLVIAADNDLSKEINVGLIKAHEAAQKVNATVKAPNFTKEEVAKGLSDFNDLAKTRGIAAINQELRGAFPLKQPAISANKTAQMSVA